VGGNGTVVDRPYCYRIKGGFVSVVAAAVVAKEVFDAIGAIAAGKRQNERPANGENRRFKALYTPGKKKGGRGGCQGHSP
jgi:hypothetical protein